MGVLESETVWMFGQMIADMGRSITFRDATTITGPTPQPNPPSYSGLVVNGAFLAGVQSIDMRATQLNGRVLPGDSFTTGAHAYTITNTVTASSNDLSGVQFTPALSGGASDGDAVTLAFAADVTINALVTAFPARLVNGTSIQMTDRTVRFRAADLPWTPTTTMKVFVEGDQYSVLSVKSIQLQGVVYGYVCQIRR